MKIVIDLDQYETDAMGGWVKFYQANPQWIGVPPPPAAQPPIAWQTQLVLSNTTRERYEQIAAQFSAPPVPVKIIDVAWGDPQRFKLEDFRCGAVAMRFTVPLTPTSYAQPGYTSLAEFGGPPTPRQASLSTVAGDFGPTALAISNGAQVTIDWSVGTPGILSLTPGQTYFINFRNWDGSKCSCADNCAASFDTHWPH